MAPTQGITRKPAGALHLVELAEAEDGLGIEADLLLGLAQRRLPGVLLDLAAAAGEGDLAAVARQGVGALGEDASRARRRRRRAAPAPRPAAGRSPPGAAGAARRGAAAGPESSSVAFVCGPSMSPAHPHRLFVSDLRPGWSRRPIGGPGAPGQAEVQLVEIVVVPRPPERMDGPRLAQRDLEDHRAVRAAAGPAAASSSPDPQARAAPAGRARGRAPRAAAGSRAAARPGRRPRSAGSLPRRSAQTLWFSSFTQRPLPTDDLLAGDVALGGLVGEPAAGRRPRRAR